MNAGQDLQNVYRETVLDHSRNPRNFRRLETANQQTEGYNPLCGDKITVYLDRDGDRIRAISFEGTGCAISLASASMMMVALQNCLVVDADRILHEAQDMFDSDADVPVHSDIDGLEALAGVRAYPSRIKCATLAWQTLQAALAGEFSQVTTE